MIIESNTELFKEVFDACIQEMMFPRIWKRQRLILIPKGNNAPNASGYRPLCLIDTAGKLLERIICRRLEACLGGEGLSDWFPEGTFDNGCHRDGYDYSKGCYQR